MINDLLQTDDNYILSNRHIRLLDIIFKQNYKQCSPSDFEKLVLNWASTVLSDEREEWEQNRAESAHVLYRLEKKSDAIKRAKCRDNKYASFREHLKGFKKISSWNLERPENSSKQIILHRGFWQMKPKTLIFHMLKLIKLIN